MFCQKICGSHLKAWQHILMVGKSFALDHIYLLIVIFKQNQLPMSKSEINQQKEVTNELVIKLRDLAKRIDNMAFKLELENNTELPSKAYIGEYKSKIERHAIEIIKAL